MRAVPAGQAWLGNTMHEGLEYSLGMRGIKEMQLTSVIHTCVKWSVYPLYKHGQPASLCVVVGVMGGMRGIKEMQLTSVIHTCVKWSVYPLYKHGQPASLCVVVGVMGVVVKPFRLHYVCQNGFHCLYVTRRWKLLPGSHYTKPDRCTGNNVNGTLIPCHGDQG